MPNKTDWEKQKIERIGEVKTNRWGTFTIVEYINSNNIVVERQDGLKFNTTYDHFTRGELKGKNLYDLSNDYGICYAINTGDKILFDLEDYDKIKDFTWYVTIAKKYVGHKRYYDYKRVEARINAKDLERMQNFILGCKNVDHINNNPLDNRKINLRLSIDKNGYNKNSLNTRIRGNNTSGHKGVSYSKTRKHWRGYVNYKGKRYEKIFKTFEEACEWVDNKRVELHGNFANMG